MSLSLAHFATGATGMTILIALIPLRVPFKQTLILLGGVWALVPDIYQLAPTYTDWMQAIHDSTVANLFWFHRILDVHDPTDSYLVAVLAVGVWVGVTAMIELMSILWAIFTNRRAEHSVELHD